MTESEKFLLARAKGRNNVTAHTGQFKRLEGGYLKLDEVFYGSSGSAVRTTTVSESTDADVLITAAVFQAGVYIRSGATAARTDTLDTAANIFAAMNGTLTVGDTVRFLVVNVSGQDITIAADAGSVAIQSAAGRTIPAGEKREVFLRVQSVTVGAEVYELYV